MKCHLGLFARFSGDWIDAGQGGPARSCGSWAGVERPLPSNLDAVTVRAFLAGEV
jgi:hypothetical protein